MKTGISIFDAIKENNLVTVNELLNQKINLHVYEPINEDSPIHYAVRNNSNDILKLLLQNNLDLNTLNKFNDTPLHLAVLMSNDLAVQLLLSAGADKELRNLNNELPIDLAHKFNNTNIVKLLSQNK